MAHGYFQQPMTLQQAEIIKALDFLQIPGTYTITSSEDVYFYPEPPSPERHDSFQNEAEKLHEKFILTEMKSVITDYLAKHGILNSDESILKVLNEKGQFSFEITPEFIEIIQAKRAELTLRTDELANDVFGGNVLIGKQILAATAVGRKSARAYLNLGDDTDTEAAPQSA